LAGFCGGDTTLVRMEREAGAIVVRRDRDGLRVLVVTAKKNPSQWLFPKGHIEPGESPEEAAVREVSEEAGVVGHVVRPVGEMSYEFGGHSYHVRYFLMEYDREHRADEGRQCVWLTPDDARKRLTFVDTRTLLDRALATLDVTCPS
jgi:8-oxo-dGTP pyrophosphatase MutT (NUDIX family)